MVGIGSDDSKDQWPALESTLTELHELCLSIWHLQFVLIRVKDPSTGQSLWEASGLGQDQETLTEPFWVQLAAKLSGVLTLPARQSLQRDYPRLYRALQDFARKSMTSYEMLQLHAPHRIGEADALQSLLKPLSSLETGHLNRTKRRFKKATELLFVPKPSEEKTIMLCKAFAREIVDAREVPVVMQAIAKQVVVTTKSVVEDGVKRAEKSVSVLSVATPTQQHSLNASITNVLLAVEGSLKSLQLSLQQYDLQCLSTAIENCHQGQISVGKPLAAALKSNIASGHYQTFKNAILPLYKSSPALKTLIGPICAEQDGEEDEKEQKSLEPDQVDKKKIEKEGKVEEEGEDEISSKHQQEKVKLLEGLTPSSPKPRKLPVPMQNPSPPPMEQGQHQAKEVEKKNVLDNW